jgi:hypothetical protein
MKRVQWFKAGGILLLAVMISAGCGRYVLQSDRRLNEITIDGSDRDWPGRSAYYLEQPNVALAVCNDDSFMYLMLRTGNREVISQVMERGLTVWLDPEGGKKKVFGVHFPLGMQNGRPSDMGNTPRDMGTSGDQPNGQMIDRPDGSSRPEMQEPEIFDASRLKRMIGSLQRFEIVVSGQDKKRLAIPVDSSGICGLAVRMDAAKDGSLIYELKVPIVLDAQRPYGIDCRQKESFGMVLEAGKAKTNMMMARPMGMNGPSGSEPEGGMSGGRPGGMNGGSPGGGRPGGGMGKPGRMQSAPEPFKFTVTVILALPAEAK